MKITIETSAKNVEAANYILAQAIKQLTDKPDVARAMDVTPTILKGAEALRKSMLDGLFAAH